MSDEATPATGSDLDRRIELIEEGYEFLLAYAAQGRETDQGPGPGSRVRDYLANMERSLEGLGDAVAAAIRERGDDLAAAGADYLAAVGEDARKSRAAVRLILAQAHIGSQLVDNLNASIHLRALLTDLFLIDSLLKSRR